MRSRWVPAALHTHRKLQLPLNIVLEGIMVKWFFTQRWPLEWLAILSEALRCCTTLLPHFQYPSKALQAPGLAQLTVKQTLGCDSNLHEVAALCGSGHFARVISERCPRALIVQEQAVDQGRNEGARGWLACNTTSSGSPFHDFWCCSLLGCSLRVLSGAMIV